MMELRPRPELMPPPLDNTESEIIKNIRWKKIYFVNLKTTIEIFIWRTLQY